MPVRLLQQESKLWRRLQLLQKVCQLSRMLRPVPRDAGHQCAHVSLQLRDLLLRCGGGFPVFLCLSFGCFCSVPRTLWCAQRWSQSVSIRSSIRSEFRWLCRSMTFIDRWPPSMQLQVVRTTAHLNI